MQLNSEERYVATATLGVVSTTVEGKTNGHPRPGDNSHVLGAAKRMFELHNIGHSTVELVAETEQEGEEGIAPA